jgi:hypothetical protein
MIRTSQRLVHFGVVPAKEGLTLAHQSETGLERIKWNYTECYTELVFFSETIKLTSGSFFFAKDRKGGSFFKPSRNYCRKM